MGIDDIVSCFHLPQETILSLTDELAEVMSPAILKTKECQLCYWSALQSDFMPKRGLFCEFSQTNVRGSPD